MANDEIKKEMEEHLNKAVQIQKEIEELTEKIYEELEKVKELSRKTEEIPLEIPEEEKEEKVEFPEVKEEVPELETLEAEASEDEGAEPGVDFTKELEKVKKIKEMLEKREEVEPKKEEVAEEEKIDEPAAEEEVSFGMEEKVEAAEAPPSEKEIEVAIGEEPLPEFKKVAEIEIEEKPAFEEPLEEKGPEVSMEEEPLSEFEKAPEIEIEEKPAFEEPLEEKEPEISIGEEKAPDFGEKEPVEAPPVEREPETPLEEKPIPEEKEIEIEESDTMQTMFSGRWKKHWQDKPESEEQPGEGIKEEPKVKPEEEKVPDIHERETVAAEAPEEKMEETIRTVPEPEVEIEPKVEIEPGEEAKPEVEMAPGAGEGGVSSFTGRRASDAIEILNKFKKTEPEEDGEVCYYEYNERRIIDSECLVNAMQNHLDEGKKLYEKLAQTEAPKDQFFVKQEIIRHQEALRGMIEIATKLLEKENSSLPQHTIEVINGKVLKETLESLSMQNWSNQDDFTFFDEYAKKIKHEFDMCTEPKVEFLKSIIDGLGI
jgi:hypothetical protein